VFSKLLEGLYHKIFINIVIGISSSIVYVEEYEKQKLLGTYSETFNTTTIDTKMYEYIKSFTSESPYNYIALLDNSLIQGAIPTCEKKDMSNYFDKDSSKYICYQNRWAHYSSKPELNLLQKTYSTVGLDFIFSPFSILSRFFKDKINSTLALYILIEEQRISLAVFDNAELLYADYLKMDTIQESEDVLLYENADDDIDLDLENSIDLDDIESIDSLENFGDIEDLDTLDDIDEFSEAQETEEEIEENADESSIDDIDGFNEDYNRFTRVQHSINNYYKDARYESKFLEKIYIADSVGSSRELKRYFEEEMFLSVYVRRLDLSAEVCEIAKAETI